MKPMLFHSADPATIAEFVGDDNWLLQQKVDGMRCMIRMTNLINLETNTHEPMIEFLTRDGRPLKSAAAKLHFQKLTEAFMDAFAEDIQRQWLNELIIDGELMTDQGILVVFDVLAINIAGSPRITTEDAQLARWSSLVDLVSNRSIPFVRLVSTAQSTQEKLELAQWVEAEGGEGLIAKRVDSPYEPGARVKHSLKLKYTQTADVVVTGKNVGESKKSIRGGEKLNYELGAYFSNDWSNPDLEPVMLPLGYCSSIGKADVEVGDVIEVEYLYVGAGGKLTQPRMVRARPDKTAVECTTEQLKFYSKAVR